MAAREETVASPYRPGYEMIADRIIELIRTDGLQPGDRLPTEQRLGVQLGASRAMVREAIKVLSAGGHVRTRRGSGIFVGDMTTPRATAFIDLSMPVDPEHIQSLFEFRCMQEMLTARLAAQRITLAEVRGLEVAVERNREGAERGDWELFIEADIAFHQGIANASHNPFLAETVATTFRLQRWAIKIVTGGAPGSLSHSAQEHMVILNAIRTGQEEEAARAMQAHVQSVSAAYQQKVRHLLTDPGH
jgi:GntR family transcriptional repressor for pyruvate dehydrogenase complex